MTNTTLAQSYVLKASKRLRALEVLLAEAAYSDVVREAQEVVELAQKAMLRQVGMEPPKQHDVGPLLLSVRDRFAPEVQARLPDLARGSAWLRREREFAFYGDIDVIPTEVYGRQEADRALAIALTAVEVAQAVVPAMES
jgi:HEPN domain-containing protein